ncbi:MAG TPA: DCC1-like thiol-disulfide oxidoreductase family protein [Micromonosporaceae bacterium]|nr:DCC1-like thiol-disulfide oxidoreductase family protein [Micromonosporaceae bacterium]
MSPAQDPGPGVHGGAGSGVSALTVLYDAGCPICRAAHRWLAGRAQLVPLEFVAAGSPEARRRFPGLDHRATLRDVTVVADNGDVYAGDAAWLACLWALDGYRALAGTLAEPAMRPLARRLVTAAATIRERTGSGGYRGDGERDQPCDDRCR